MSIDNGFKPSDIGELDVIKNSGFTQHSKDDIIVEMKRRGEKISPVLPNANWIGIEGNFTPVELRCLADHVEDCNVNKN